jgi:hypothetical protein
MRTLLSAVLALFLPARGTRRATPIVPASRPRVAAVRAVVPPVAEAGTEPLRIPPYLLRWEEATPAEREVIRQRMRRLDAAEAAA